MSSHDHDQACVPAIVDDRPIDVWEQVLNCSRCGMQVLALLLSSVAWIHRRVDRVTFRDHRTVRRQVSVDFTTPATAPRVLVNGMAHRLLPLAIMRRKSLVNFDLRDEDDRPVPLLGLRQRQAVTEAAVLGLARAVLGTTTVSPEVAAFIGALSAGTQEEMMSVYGRARRGDAPSDIRLLVADRRFKEVMNRLTEGFVLMVLVPEGGPARRVYKLRYDEPLSLQYREPGCTPANPKHYVRLPSVVSSWRPARILASLGWTPTRFRFPVPGAENTRSFHFEVHAPPGVEICSATILAGRPNEATRPSFDNVSGGFPTVDLHVVDVPRGSLSRAQITMQVARYPWLIMAVLSCWLEFAALTWAAFRLESGVARDNASGAGLFITLTAGLAAILWRPADHRMAQRMLSALSSITAFSTLLVFVGGALLAFEGDESLRVPLLALAGAAGVIAVVMTVTWFRTGAPTEKARISPWEQGRFTAAYVDVMRRSELDTYTDFARATRKYGYDQPSIKVASAEAEFGDEDEYDIDDGLLADLRSLIDRFLETEPHERLGPQPERSEVVALDDPGREGRTGDGSRPA